MPQESNEPLAVRPEDEIPKVDDAIDDLAFDAKEHKDHVRPARRSKRHLFHEFQDLPMKKDAL